ncbi:tyrosine-type recombinase/integrase [Nonomuraea sp. K274]|uniref:Tyrosine-type recombinase/integrase n=1 Tax=Nonomuraea cypriaca TaxID=1187855 RepID=A0A931A6L7_9ACTN|nr:site-specific integrase [Nonomuraea cypriaca]MBF8187316.1 tyrosine-type recombinase/integrase [Nonomuraea cypriaca]
MRKARGPDGKILRDDDGKPVLERDPARYGKGSRWRLRYDGPDGRERNESFGKKVDADNRKKVVEADLLRGTYIDPDAGKITFKKQAEEVIDNRTLDPGSRRKMRERLAKHVYPVIGAKEIGQLSRRPSMLQQLVKRLEAAKLAPSYIDVIMTHVGLVFSVAIEDELIVKNPLKSSTVVLPKVVKKKFVPWTADQVLDMADVLPARYQAVVDTGAGIGMRHGEIFGFSPDDVEWLRGTVAVNRQIKLLNGTLIFALPKGEKTREVPLSEGVKVTLAEHMRLFPPIEVTLPWADVDGDPVTVRLFFANTLGGPVHPVTFREVWNKGLERAGIVPRLATGEKRGNRYREHGMHMLRHYFASVLLTDGENPKAVADWLGHGDGGALLLRTYAHLMPRSEQRMRKTIDAALRRPGSAADGPQTAHRGAE